MEKYTLKVIRAMNDLNITQMAERLGVTRQYYGMMESHKIPVSAKVLVRICKEFGLELSQIKD